jgi:iron complex outermembrane receptor protein
MAQTPDVITVTAQKREQTLQETPVSVAVVTDEAIEQSQIRDAADLSTLVPSLTVAEFAASSNTQFTLRGVGTSSFNPGLEPSVGVFVDGVYRPRAGAAINDLLSVERVEVIRGPQSTLFGRNTPAGVVSFITKEPEFEFGGDAELTFGNYGQRSRRRPSPVL